MEKVNWFIIDLEATCWPPGDPRRKRQKDISEIIEIYCAQVSSRNEDFVFLNDFHSLVQPQNAKDLSVFCTDLTGIQQADIDSAPSLSQCMNLWKTWVDECVFSIQQDRPFYLASWGQFDHRLLGRAWLSVQTAGGVNDQKAALPWVHIDIQTLFEHCCRAHRNEQSLWFKKSGLTRISGLSLREALKAIDTEVIGEPHSAKSDTIAALECLKFATQEHGLTPKEATLVQAVQQEVKQGRQYYWRPLFATSSNQRTEFERLSQGLIKRGFLKRDLLTRGLSLAT